jgi:hypothetical protein
MDDPLPVTRDVAIPLSEVLLRTSRSGMATSRVTCKGSSIASRV